MKTICICDTNIIYMADQRMFLIDTEEHAETLAYVARKIEGSHHFYHEPGYGFSVDWDTETPQLQELTAEELSIIIEEFHPKHGEDMLLQHADYFEDIVRLHPEKFIGIWKSDAA